MKPETKKILLDFLKKADFDEILDFAKDLKSVGISLNSYNNPTPIAVSLIRVKTSEGLKFLVVKRKNAPGVGGLAFPGGYVDYLESAEVAACRETREETGLSLNPLKFKLIKSVCSTTNNNLLLFCLYEEVLNLETIDFEFCNEEVFCLQLADKNSSLVFPIHQDMLQLLYEF